MHRLVLRFMLACCVLAPTFTAVPLTHATVAEVSAANRASGNGSTTVFPYSFRIAADTALEVLVDDAVQVLNTDYTVSGVGDAGGGSVTFTDAPANGTVVTILRKQPFGQGSDYQRAEAFPADRLELDLDKLAMQVQQLKEQVQRALKFKKSSSLTDQYVDAPTVGYFARAKAGGGIEWAVPTNAGALSSPVGISDGGTGATTAAGARTALGVPGLLSNTSINAKGDLLTGTADDTLVRVPVGTNGQILTADSTAAGGVSWTTAPAAATGFNTGDIKATFATSETGWILLNDGTIGSATSGATTRANADTENLYTLLWTNCIDQWCPVTGGRGASAAADFAANKPLALPRAKGHTLADYGAGTIVASGSNAAVDTTADTLTVDANTNKWVTGNSVVFTLSSGTVTGLTSGNTYYVIRSSSTLVKLASTLANAQNGTAIDFTAKSSPVWTITHTMATRVLGETGGEVSHAMSSTELLAHTHTAWRSGSSGAATGSSGATYVTTSGSTGSNNAMNVMQPTLFVNYMIKL